MEFEGKVAVITGAANGIGRSCAELIIERGGSLVLGDIDLDEGLKLQNELGERALFVEANVRNLAAIQALADKAVNHFGGLDILVNNAAVALNGVVDEIDEDRWQTVIDTNLTGFWRAMKACVPHMRERGGGSIVNMEASIIPDSLKVIDGREGFPMLPNVAISVHRTTNCEAHAALVADSILTSLGGTQMREATSK